MSRAQINDTNTNPDDAPQGADKINANFVLCDADTASISANSSAIAANTANITSNTANIATNTANIVTNTANIATNTAGIAALTAPVASLNQRIVNRISIQASGDVTGATDSANAIAAEVAAVAALRTVTGFSAKCGTVLIEFESGDFYLNANALMGGGGLASKGWGIRFVGRGQEETVLHLLGTGGAMCVNKWWLQPQFDDMSLYSSDTSNNFIASLEQGSLSNVQDYRFSNCGWRGSWNHLALLTGGNNNSEWKWNDCYVDAALTDWLCIPATLTGTMTNTSATIAIANTLGTYVVGSTCTFGTAVGTGGGGVATSTTYYIVVASSSGISVSATAGGTAITFNANGSSTVVIGSDQFVNHSWHNCKFWDITNGSWINAAFGGQFRFSGICDVSNYHPSVDTYLFNLTGTAHAGGVCNFLCDGLRVEHTSDNALLLHNFWDKGNITFNNLDTSSQVGVRATTNEYVRNEIINVTGASLMFRDSQLLGVHRYINNSSNFQFQNWARYEGCTLLDNPSAGNFALVTNAGTNSGGYPRIRFEQCRNTLNAGTAGYHEIVDSDVNWYLSCAGQPKVRRVSLVGTNSDWPGSGGKTTFRLPLHAIIVEFLFFKAAGGAAGAFQYTVQTQEATPTVLAGGAATPLAGTNSSLAITPYVLNPTTTPALCFDVGTSDLARTIDIIDTLGGGRSGSMTAFRCLLSYIG